MEKLKISNRSKIEKEVDNSLKEAMKDEVFINLVKKLKLDAKTTKVNVSKLEETIKEIKTCQNCKGLYECQNKYEGYLNYPEMKESKLLFSLKPCRYKKKLMDNINNKDTSKKEIINARMKDIDINDKTRVPLIKWLKKFYDNYDPFKKEKGLYLHGSFGSGKTYLLACLFNELKEKKNYQIEIVYFPDLLRELKDDFSVVQDKLSYLENVDLLLLDDIGAENVTNWGRDEILGTILQYRMNNGLTTFFTSNLNINELEHHLSISKNNEDIVKARRIVERIKQLTEDMELISINRRK